jgi:hypothetical protein
MTHGVILKRWNLPFSCLAPQFGKLQNVSNLEVGILNTVSVEPITEDNEHLHLNVLDLQDLALAFRAVVFVQ